MGESVGASVQVNKAKMVAEEAESLKEKNGGGGLGAEGDIREESAEEVGGNVGEMERRVMEARREVAEKEEEVRRLISAAETSRKEVKVKVKPKMIQRRKM